MNFYVLFSKLCDLDIHSFQIDVTQALERLYNKKSNETKNKRPPKTFKLKRAQMNHLQTLREISAHRDKQEQPDSELAGTSSEATA